MTLNRTKVLEAAQKYLQKGQHDKAIAEYEKLVKEDPRDVRTLLKIGDLHTRRGSNTAAIETYGQVAQQYAKQGFFLKAVAVYKQILKLDPEQLDVSVKLAAMYEELALVSDALTTYEAVAEGYARVGETDKALQTMQKMVNIDPDNVAVRIKYAEALSRAEKTLEAAEAFASGAALLKEQGRTDDYIRVAERQLYHQSGNVALAKELANLYLEMKDAKRALAKLQLCFKDDPRDIQTLEMLAEAFRQLGQGSKTISVLREIARIHAELGGSDARRRAMERILDLDPDDPEARQALQVESAAGDAPQRRERKFGATMIDERSADERARDAARREAEAEAESEEAAENAAEDAAENADAPAELHGDLLDADASLDSDEVDDDVLIVEDDSVPPAAETPRKVREPETQPERIARLMAEAEASSAAGMWLEVEGLLGEVLELNPDETEAREQLKDLYLQLERNDEAMAQLLLLADLWMEQDLDRAIGYMQHAVWLAPDDPRPKLRLEAMSAAVAASPDAADAVVAELDPLDRPIEPDDFGAPVPRGASGETPLDALNAMLDAPIQDDFEAPSPQHRVPRPRQTTLDSLPRPSAVDDLLAGMDAADSAAADAAGDFDAMLDAPVLDDFEAALDAPIQDDFDQALDAPIQDDFEAALDAPIQDDFDVAPPAAKAPETVPPLSMLDAPIEDDFDSPHEALTATADAADVDAMAMLDAPMDHDFSSLSDSTAPVADDFGLSDERFERSDLLEVEAAPGEAAEEALDDFELIDDDDDEPPSQEITTQGEVPRELLSFGSEATATAASDAAQKPEAEAEDAVLEVTAEPEPAPEFASAEAAPVLDEESNPEVDETIDEAEFFFDQGMFEDAIDTVQEAMLIFAGSAALAAKLKQYEEALEAHTRAAEAAAQEDEDDSFKLAEQLAEQLGEIPSEAPGDSVDVEQVFAQFKKGVAEQVSADDSATHFDLGIAYKEMGLTDDAISEFRTAATDPARACNALTMVGMCMLERGDAPGAIQEFERALQSEQKDARADLGLNFEIGLAYEAVNDLPKAIAAFEKAAARDGSFRNVLNRLATLREKLGAAAPAADNGDSDGDDLDRAFDELMGQD